MTRQDLERRVRQRYEALANLSGAAADEAVEQAGLPSVFVWHLLTVPQLGALAVSCSIRLLEVS